ncbi:MAG: hypothetical protein HQK51_01745 [Oligoflexia bacterium]|nr:hypothetical protein [Oligoflexia bacterium]
MKNFIVFILSSSLLLLFLTSCSSIEVMSAKVSGSIFKKASLEIENEKNLSIFKEATPAHLKLMEGLLYLYPQEMDLLSTLTKSYTAYALLADESDLIEYELTQGPKFNEKKEAAIKNYSKALTYGLRYLELKNIVFSDLMKNSNDLNKMLELLTNNLNVEDENGDIELVFFLAQSMGGLINLQKNKPEFLSMLPIVKTLFDWVCVKKPNFYNGGCDLFYGVYEMGRPPMLGGNPEKGKAYFLKAIKENPQNLFIRAMFLQYYYWRMNDEDGFKIEIAKLESELVKFEQQTKWTPTKEIEKFVPDFDSRLNLFNSVAQKRFEIFKRNEKTVF